MNPADIFSSVLDEIASIETILSPDNRRNLSAKQKAIMVQHRINGLTTLLNQIFQIKEIPIEELNEKLELVLSRISDLSVCKFPSGDIFVKYNLEMLRFYLAGYLMASWGKGGYLRILGSAQALSNILIGIEIIDTEPLLVEFEHPEFRKRHALAINLTNMAAGLYYIASTSLYSIEKRVLEEWSLKALDGNERILSIINNTWNLQELSKVQTTTGDSNILGFIIAIFGIFNSMIKYILLLYARYGDTWPESTKQYQFLNTESTDKFLDSVTNLLEIEQNYVDDLQEFVNSGGLGQNENPFANNRLRNVLFILELNKITLQGLKIVNGIAKGDMEKNLHALYLLVVNLTKFLEKNQVQLNDKKFIASRLGEILDIPLKYYMFFATLHAIYSDDIHHLEELKDKFGLYLAEEGKERFPHIYTLFLVGSLTICTKHKQKEKMLEIAEELLKMVAFFPYQPRDAFAFTLLGELTKLVLEKQKPEEFLLKIEESKLVLEAYSSTGLMSELEEYLEAIKLALEGKEPTFEIKRISNPCAFEPYSFIIPNFEPYAREIGLGKIEYLPFNLESDYVTRD